MIIRLHHFKLVTCIVGSLPANEDKIKVQAWFESLNIQTKHMNS